MAENDASSIANTNQSRGTNPVVAMRYAMRFLGSRRNPNVGDASTSGGGQDAAWFKNMETLETAKSMLKREEEANSANIWLGKQQLSPGLLSDRITAGQEASKLYDRQGRHIGQQAFNDKDLGISMAGVSIPTTHEDAMERDNQAAELAMKKATHAAGLREEGARNRASERDAALSAKDRAKKVAGLEKERDKPLPPRSGAPLPKTETTTLIQQENRDRAVKATFGELEPENTRLVPRQFMEQVSAEGNSTYDKE